MLLKTLALRSFQISQVTTMRMVRMSFRRPFRGDVRDFHLEAIEASPVEAGRSRAGASIQREMLCQMRLE